MKNQEPTKAELLDHYADPIAKPRRYIQYDGRSDVEPGDPVVVPDNDTDCVMYGLTWELHKGEYAVRVLVAPDTPPDDAVRLLTKVANTIADEGRCQIPECDQLAWHRTMCIDHDQMLQPEAPF